MTPKIVGAPDWQHAVVTATNLGATVPAGVNTVTVDIAPNTETLVVTGTDMPIPSQIECQGVQSGLQYPGVFRYSEIGITAHLFIMFIVASPLDTQVTITLQTAPTAEWYVYSDSGALIVNTPDVVALYQPSGGVANLNGILAMGSDGTDAHPISTDATGAVKVVLTGGASIVIGANFLITSPAVQTYPPASVPVPAGQTVSIVSVNGFTNTGTATVTVLQNGVAIAAYTNLAITDVNTFFSNPAVTINNGDTLSIQVTAVGSAPAELTVSVNLQVVF
jgi:hypothetical protein